MKTIKFLLIAMIMIPFASCNNSNNEEANAEGFSNLETEIKEKFGSDAYYTELNISYDKSVGNIISLTVTKDPKSLKMGQWNLLQGNWKQHSEISLELPEGTEASDFMFQLNEDINLSKMGELVEKSIEQLKKEKDLNNPVLNMAFIKFPKNGEIDKSEYVVMLNPENGGTTFTFNYTLKGELINMDY